MIGYASCLHSGPDSTIELKQQADVIARECERLHLRLTELVGEREPPTSKGLARPGLNYSLDQIAAEPPTG